MKVFYVELRNSHLPVLLRVDVEVLSSPTVLFLVCIPSVLFICQLLTRSLSRNCRQYEVLPYVFMFVILVKLGLPAAHVIINLIIFMLFFGSSPARDADYNSMNELMEEREGNEEGWVEYYDCTMTDDDGAADEVVTCSGLYRCDEGSYHDVGADDLALIDYYDS